MKSSVTLALIFRFKHPGLKKVYIVVNIGELVNPTL